MRHNPEEIAMFRSRAWLLAAAVAALAAGAACAQGTYPDKPIRLVVGFSAGGPTDLPARAIAEKLGASLGQRVVVENKTGAAGQIATHDVLSKPRDGYNLNTADRLDAVRPGQAQ